MVDKSFYRSQPVREVSEEPEKTLVIRDKTLKGGFTPVPNVVIESKSLSLGAKVVYTLLLKYAWQNGEAFPGQERLAESTGCTVRTIRTYLTELKNAGLVSWKRRGLTKTNIYYINDLEEFLDRKSASDQEVKNTDRINNALPDRKSGSAQNRKLGSDKEYPDQEDTDQEYSDSDLSLDSNSERSEELESKLRTPNSSLESVKALSESIEDPSTEKGAETSGAYRTTLCLSRAPEGEKACQFNTDAREENKTPCFDKSFNKAPGGRSDRCSTRTAVGCRKDKPLPGAENNVCLEDDSKLEPSEPDKSLKNPLGKRYSSVVEATPGEQVNNNHSSGVNAACCSPGGPDVILTAGDIIAVLGDSLREVLEPPAKAYAIAGRLYNLYDFPAAEVAINALRRRIEQGHRIQNPVAYLMKIAREKKKEFEAGETREFEEQEPFSEKYPEEHKRRLEEVRKIYAERRQYLEDYLEVTEKQTASVVGFSVPAQVVADCPP